MWRPSLHSGASAPRRAVRRYDARMPTQAAALAPIVLPDTEGREVRLGSLWESQPAVVVFLRHYG